MRPPAHQSDSSSDIGKIVVGILIAVAIVAVVGWFGYAMVTANDDLECAMEQATLPRRVGPTGLLTS